MHDASEREGDDDGSLFDAVMDVEDKESFAMDVDFDDDEGVDTGINGAPEVGDFVSVLEG